MFEYLNEYYEDKRQMIRMVSNADTKKGMKFAEHCQIPS